MQLKTLLVASLATLGSAAVVEERQIPSNILSDIASNIPSAILTALPSDIQRVYSQATAFLIPLATAIPPSLLSEIETVLATLPTSGYESFFSSVVSQLPSDIQSSYSQLRASLTSEIGGLTSATAAPTGTTSGPIATNTSDMTESMTGSQTTRPQTTGGSQTTGSRTGSGTTSAPTTSQTPNSGSKTYVGLSVLGVAGILGLALAL
ncbi:hypothetical protein ABW20_dc0103795 [Dactylellina cionopaga]|nr:hypothetical protein ABW20_dc0103795 [Dactylellina cionopaga]